MSVVVFDNVHFWYEEKEEILRGVSFEINEGEFISIVGPNGGGKTTLVKLILGLIKPTFGNIYLFGKSPQKSTKYVGYLPQISNVRKDIPISVHEFVKLSCYRGLLRKYPKDIDLKVDNILKMLDIYDLRDKVIGELSGGQFQRMLLARAIINDPKLLILDEPTNFIDENTKKNFYEIIMSFKRSKTIIVVSHDLNMVAKFTDRVFCLNKEIFLTCTMNEISQNLNLIYSNLFSYVKHEH
ncbi:MAG: metal ABC transporter ATP-binding protein [bacterium]